MKKLIAVLALVPALCFGAANDIRVTQTNSDNTGLAPTRLVAPPAGGANGIMGFNGATILPVHWTIGSGLTLAGGVLDTVAPSPVSWASLTGKPTTVAAAGLLDAVTFTDLSAGLATKFNIPVGTTAQYIRGDGSLATLPASGSGTVTSITVGTGLSGGTITTSGTISLPNTGTAGTYQTVTTDAQGRVTGGTSMSINDSPGRSLVSATNATGYQISATRMAQGCYEGSFSTTSTIGGPSSATVFLETADTNSTIPGDWTVKAQQTYSNTITLAVVINQNQGNNWSFCRNIPAGKFVRLRVGGITGTASASINTTQQETTY